MDLLPAILGALLVIIVAWDVFESVLLPRPTPNPFRVAHLLVRATWRIWRRIGLRFRPGERRDRFLGTYAPLIVVVLLVCWLALLISGYGLLLYAFRDELRPVPDLPTAIYAAATAVLTLGFDGAVPVGPFARLVALIGAASGLGIVALVITYLFMLFGSFQRREVLVLTLDARTGSPPSGIALIEWFVALDLLDELPALFEAWAEWSAEVLDSHVAYPILGFFRSSHDNISWVSSVGAVLDAASVVRAALPDVPQGHAKLMLRIGGHFVEDITNFLKLDASLEVGVDRADFELAMARLASAGLRVDTSEMAWRRFADMRSQYAGRLEALAHLWATPPAQWLGERAPTHEP